MIHFDEKNEDGKTLGQFLKDSKVSRNYSQQVFPSITVPSVKISRKALVKEQEVNTYTPQTK